ncbi:MAG: MaoC family dehydratase N-terminal domain-containing protein [Alphaproteobacteria bacterium]|nr:MaoC family dehydratase N-terminal domain-containing protein [Alphaproteobacteria bacterium]
MTWGKITDETLAAAAELIGVPLRRDRMQWIETATRDAIRHFAWGIGDNNPLWFDPEYAAKSPIGTIAAPPCILYAVDSTIVAPKLAGVQWIYAGTEWTWYDHIRMDDSFRVEAKLSRQEVKTGRRFGQWALQIGDIDYYRQDGRLIASAVGKCARTPRGDGSGRREGEDASGHVAHRYAPAELADIEEQVLSEPRQGAEPLCWEDVAVGDTVPAVVKGPLTITDILAWYAAAQGALHYGGVHGDALRYRRRHDDYHINKETGAKDSAGRGHLEASTGRDVGMGGAYDVGPQRISWAQHMLTNWIGDHGFLHKLNVDVRLPNMVGDTIWWRGTVTGKRQDGGVSLLDLNVEARNQLDVLSANGTATVALPSRQHGAIPLPLDPA